MWHSFVPRSQRDGVQLFWVFVEPAAQLAVLMVLFSVIGRAAGYGTSFALFLLTGIAVLNLYTSTSSAVMGAVKNLGHPRRIATVGMFAPALAAVGFRFTVGVVSSLLLGAGVLHWQRLHGVPADLLACVEAFAVVALLGFGTGLLRGYSVLFLPTVERVYSILSRSLLFISGVFYVPSFLPPEFRGWLAWNPVLHAIDWFRTGVYAGYPDLVLSRFYLGAVVLVSIALGMALIWHDRRRILE